MTDLRPYLARTADLRAEDLTARLAEIRREAAEAERHEGRLVIDVKDSTTRTVGGDL